jgi:hypothetical protein
MCSNPDIKKKKKLRLYTSARQKSTKIRQTLCTYLMIGLVFMKSVEIKQNKILLTVPLKQYAWQAAWCHNQVNDLDTGEGGGTRHGLPPIVFKQTHLLFGVRPLPDRSDKRYTDYTHCKENPIYVFLSWELRGLGPNSTFMWLWAIYVFLGSVHIYFPAAE